MNKIKLKLLLLSLFIIGLSFAYKNIFEPKNDEIEINDKPFTSDNLKPIVKDSFLNMINKVYFNGVRVSEAKEKIEIKIFNQNQTLNDFLNANLLLTKIKNFGFDISYSGRNDTINGIFEKIIIDSTTYINLPTDVIFGVISKLRNK